MFNSHKGTVRKLKNEDAHFKKIFEKHNNLEDEVNKLTRGDIEHIEHFELEGMKKELLSLKDSLYDMVVKELEKKYTKY